MHDAHDRDPERGLLLIAGGIGISPIRAMAESFDIVPAQTDLIYRAQSAAEAPLLDELLRLAARRGIRLHLLLGKRGSADIAYDPLGPDEISRLVPDAAARDVFVCGPLSLMDRVRSSMRALGATDKQIHFELFA